jgi:hypothetical protein
MAKMILNGIDWEHSFNFPPWVPVWMCGRASQNAVIFARPVSHLGRNGNPPEKMHAHPGKPQTNISLKLFK